jgi:hypothetical protein
VRGDDDVADELQAPLTRREPRHEAEGRA